MMDTDTISTLYVEIVDDDETCPDPASLAAVNDDLVRALRQEGVTVEPQYTGEKGLPELLVQFVPGTMNFLHAHWGDISRNAHRVDTAAKDIKDVADATLGVIGVVDKTQQIWKRQGKEAQGTLHLEIKTDGTRIIEGSPDDIATFLAKDKEAQEKLAAAQKKQVAIKVPASPRKRQKKGKSRA